jgi:hypothetical protein
VEEETIIVYRISRVDLTPPRMLCCRAVVLSFLNKVIRLWSLFFLLATKVLKTDTKVFKRQIQN